MSTALHAAPLTSRAFEDLWEEVTDVGLSVRGRLPEGFVGTLHRIVPTAFDWPKGSFQHWFDGHGQVHAIRFDGRGGARYRNRFVATPALERSRRTGRPVGNFGTPAPQGPWDMLRGEGGLSTANTNVLRVGDRLLALQEGGHPFALDPETLETRGPDRLGCLAEGEAFSAHPHWDPLRREGVAASMQFGRKPHLSVRSFDASGAPRGHFTLPLPYMPLMVHDFGLSERHVAVPIFPFVMHPLPYMTGLASPLDASRWEPERGAFVLVARRDGSGVRRHELPPMFSFHVVNCFDEADTVVLDLLTTPSGEILRTIGHFRKDAALVLPPGALTRLRLHADGRTEVEVRHEGGLEFPRIDARRQGQAYRFSYHGAGVADGVAGQGEPFGAIARYDEAYATLARWTAPAGHVVGEPVPVPKEPNGPEEAVWLLSAVYDPARHRSRIVVLDGEDFGAEPIAEVELPHHLPLGFHGNFSRG